MKGYVNGWLLVAFVLVSVLSAYCMIAQNRAEERAVREVFVSPERSVGIRGDGAIVWEAGYQDGKLMDFISLTDKDGKVKENDAKEIYAYMGN